MGQWYEELFENYADKYEQEPFTKGTNKEVDFIEKEINFNKGIRILDIGCGTGRHSIELASRGYIVTGVDLSDTMLRRARVNAMQRHISVDFIQADARKINFVNEYNLVIMLCEGSFPLMETDEMNFEILQNAAKALKSKGKLIFTTLNGLFPIFHSVKDFINGHYEEEKSQNNNFDLMTFRDYSEYTIEDDSGNKKTIRCNERYYIPSEITWLLKSLGFSNIEILGCDIGDWSKDKKLTVNHYEMLVVAEK